MEYRGKQLAGDLVHVRDHQQQTLGSGIGGGQSTGTQRAVHSTGCARFGLHLNNLYPAAENVLQAVGRPLVDPVRHRG